MKTFNSIHLSLIALALTMIPLVRGESMRAGAGIDGSKSGARAEIASTKKPAAPPAAIGLTPAQQDKLLALLNEGTPLELTAIRGIASTRAAAIIGARPFQKVHEVILVPGVGAATLDRILKHGKTLTRTAAKSAKS